MSGIVKRSITDHLTDIGPRWKPHMLRATSASCKRSCTFNDTAKGEIRFVAPIAIKIKGHVESVCRSKIRRDAKGNHSKANVVEDAEGIESDVAFTVVLDQDAPDQGVSDADIKTSICATSRSLSHDLLLGVVSSNQCSGENCKHTERTASARHY